MSHSQKPIHCNDEGDVIGRESDRGQYDHHGDQAGLRDPSSSDTGGCRCDTGRQTHKSNEAPSFIICSLNHYTLLLPYCEDLTKVHLHIVNLSNKDGRQCFIQSGSVHVDGGAHRQHEARDSLIDLVVLLQTLEGDGQRGRAEGRKQDKKLGVWIPADRREDRRTGGQDSPGGRPQGRHQRLQQPGDEDEGVLPSDDKIKSGKDQSAVDHQADDDCDGVHAQLASHLGQVVHLHDLSCDEEQDTNRAIPERRGGGGLLKAWRLRVLDNLS